MGEITRGNLFAAIGGGVLAFLGCDAPSGTNTAVQALTVDQLHESATIVVAHTHRLTTADFETAITGGVSGLGVDLITDGNDWEDGLRETQEANGIPTGWDSFNRFADRISDLDEQVGASGNRYRIAATTQDIICARIACGDPYPSPPSLAIIVGTEGGQLIGSEDLGTIDRTRIRLLHSQGWRKTQLVYSYGNGDFDEFSRQWFNGTSFQPDGVLAIAELNRVGVTIDTMHLDESMGSAQNVYNLVAASSAPILTSHNYPPTDASGLHWGYQGDIRLPIAEAVAESGGGYGVVGFFSYTSSANGTLHYYAHDSVVDVAAQLAVAKSDLGADHIAFGGDYMPPHTNQGGEYTYEPATLASLEDLTGALRDQGFTDDEVLKVLGGNMMTLYERTWNPTRDYSGGPARFYVCTNSDSSAECLALRAHGGEGDFNHRAITCRALGWNGPIGLQTGYDASGWHYWGVDGNTYPCQDGTLLAVSWSDGSANATFRICGDADTDPVCVGGRASGGSGTSAAQAINCAAPASLGNMGVIGLELAFNSSWQYYSLTGMLSACAGASTLTVGWGSGVTATAQVQLCDNNDGNAVCDAAKSNGSRGAGVVRAISCYSSAPSKQLHGNVGLELVWVSAYDTQLGENRGRWMYYGIGGGLYPCVEGSVLVVRQ